MRVDDVVLPFPHETPDAPGCDEDVLRLFRVTRPLDIPNTIKALAASGTSGRAMRQSVHLPALLAKIFGKRQKKGS